MTSQEAFDKVYTHFITNKGKLSYRRIECDFDEEVISCQYRGPEGVTCAVGLLLPDEIYDEKFEGDSITGLVAFHSEVDLLFNGVNSDLLYRMQVAHDAAAKDESRGEAYMESFTERLNDIAQDLHLTIPGESNE